MFLNTNTAGLEGLVTPSRVARIEVWSLSYEQSRNITLEKIEQYFGELISHLINVTRIWARVIFSWQDVCVRMRYLLHQLINLHAPQEMVKVHSTLLFDTFKCVILHSKTCTSLVCDITLAIKQHYEHKTPSRLHRCRDFHIATQYMQVRYLIVCIVCIVYV